MSDHRFHRSWQHGRPMAANLVKAGHGSSASTSCRRNAGGRGRRGVAIAASRRRGGRADADVVVTMLPAGKHVLRSGPTSLPAAQARRAVHRLLDHRRGQRAAGARAWRRRARHRRARRAGLRRRRRREGGDADLHVRRLGRRVRARPSRCWRRWASGSCIAARPAPARRPRSATT